MRTSFDILLIFGDCRSLLELLDIMEQGAGAPYTNCFSVTVKYLEFQITHLRLPYSLVVCDVFKIGIGLRLLDNTVLGQKKSTT